MVLTSLKPELESNIFGFNPVTVAINIFGCSLFIFIALHIDEKETVLRTLVLSCIAIVLALKLSAIVNNLYYLCM